MGISKMGPDEAMGRGIPGPRFAEIEREPETVAVLGAGPAGLLAAHAVELAGRHAVVFSKADQGGQILKSHIGPATYLHEAIPDLTSADPDGEVAFRKVGTSAGYALKVYGSKDHPTSWDKFEGDHPAWDLQPVYDELWTRFEPKLVAADVDAPLVRELLDSFPLVINTVPLYNLCHADHAFPFRRTWCTSEPMAGLDRFGENVILYDGTVGAPSDRYRSSTVFGRSSTEYGSKPNNDAFPGLKVQETNCDCFPEVVRAGRFGKWQPGVLVNHAFKEVFTGMFDQFEGS